MKFVELGLILVVAAALSAGIVRAMLPWLHRHALAKPNARSSHRIPTPQGGGIAVIAATIACVVGAMAFGLGAPASNVGSIGMVLAATVLLACVGAADDLRDIGVAPRLALQAFAVALVIASLPGELRLAPLVPWWIERGFLLVGCLWFVNLTNFMDGLDWMTVAEFVPLAAGLTIVGLLGALPPHGVIVAIALGGGLLGFAPFNRPVARIFLGDVGSLPIGLLFGWLLILLAIHGHFTAALVMPLYYLADATLTLLRRIANREPFWQAHRTHFYQRAMDRGFGVRGIFSRVLIVNLVLVGLAVASVNWPGPLSATVALVGGGALVGFLLHRFARGPA